MKTTLCLSGAAGFPIRDVRTTSVSRARIWFAILAGALVAMALSHVASSLWLRVVHAGPATGPWSSRRLRPGRHGSGTTGLGKRGSTRSDNPSVTIHGGSSPLLLVDDPNATAITAAEIQTALTQHMATIASRARRPADSGAEAAAVAAAGAQ